jgi:hypothetical protein
MGLSVIVWLSSAQLNVHERDIKVRATKSLTCDPPCAFLLHLM